MSLSDQRECVHLQTNWSDTEHVAVLTAAVASYFKALLMMIEGRDLLTAGHLVPSVFTSYTGIYHLGLSHMLAQQEPPTLVGDGGTRWIDKVRSNLSSPDKDASARVEHYWVAAYLNERATGGIAVGIRSAFKDLQDFRNDLQYGPRLRDVGDRFLFYSCRNPSRTVRRDTQAHLSKITELFEEVYVGVDFAYPILLNDHSKFFLHDPAGLGPYYSNSVVSEAQQIHSRLAEQYIKRIKRAAAE